MSKQTVTQSVRKLVPSTLTTNKQRVLATLLQTRSRVWVPRSQFAHIASATARLRELRRDGFVVECNTSPKVRPAAKTTSLFSLTEKPTFYRLNPTSVTVERVQKVFTPRHSVRG